MKKWQTKAILSVIAVFTIVSCVSLFNNKSNHRNIASDSVQDSSQYSLYKNERLAHDIEKKDLYLSKIQPIFNNRCIACHACLNSPCQLNLTSFSGVDRGAIQDDIYDFRTIDKKSPTRLGIDVPQSYDWKTATQKWREKIWFGSNGKLGFFEVVNRTSKTPEERLSKSLLYQMLLLKQDYSASHPNGELDKPFMAEQSRTCPAPETTGISIIGTNELTEYKENLAWAGMPYGFPKLSSTEMANIEEWIANGSEPPSAEVQRQLEQPSNPAVIKKWESFFNQSDYPHRITARYIYEHLFLANIYFDDMPGEFFRLIRAFCRYDGTNCYELPTHRPTDDPKTSTYYRQTAAGTIFYRFQKVTGAIVHKSHSPFGLSDRKLEKWNDIFISKIPADIKDLPPYGDEAGGNPFKTFQNIPADSRYKFLLEDSYFFVMSFIKGPVCRGTGALSVIDDHFWVFFLKPESDVTITKPGFFSDAGNKLAVPAFDGNKWNLLPNRRLKARIIKKEHMDRYMTSGFGLNDVWDGDGNNPNAVLTVYRHEDSASVSKGALGESPKTMWLLDYPIFEDIYYNLVGTYDVYAPIIHSVKSRLHMDASRFNSQDMFLGLIPNQDMRDAVRKQFTKDGVPSKKGTCKVLGTELCAIYHQSAAKMRDEVYPYAGPKINSKFKVTDTANPQKDVAEQILANFPQEVTRHTNDPITKKSDAERESIELYLGRTDLTMNDAEKIFATFAGKKGLFASYLPELSYVQVIDKANATVQWYSLIHNRERHNVAFFEEIAPEKERLWPEKDSINIVKGFVGSYANAIFSVNIDRLPEFADNILNLRTIITAQDLINPKNRKLSLDAFYKKFLISRHNPNFWKYFDNMNSYAKQEGITPQSDKYEGSIIDLNRYINE